MLGPLRDGHFGRVGAKTVGGDRELIVSGDKVRRAVEASRIRLRFYYLADNEILDRNLGVRDPFARGIGDRAGEGGARDLRFIASSSSSGGGQTQFALISNR